MTMQRTKNQSLSEEEWKELIALKNAINIDPATVHPKKMELFVDLMVRSLKERGG